jgi:cob(I)alamin adenosyltransferase
MVLAVDGIPDEIVAALTRIQHELFDLGGELAVPGYRTITTEYIERLEQTLDHFNDALPPLKEFILPGGGAAASACHLTRAITRRAERLTWSAMRTEDIAREVPQYLNRLSDLLFVIARVLARHESGQEVMWQPGTR